MTDEMTDDQEHKFLRGVLFGLCSRGVTSFDASGPSFHDAFGVMLRSAARGYPQDITKVAYHLLQDFDPVFGVYAGAEHMILVGMRDLIVTLDGPRLERARFKISADDAVMHVLGISWGASFCILGEEYRAALDKQRAGHSAVV